MSLVQSWEVVERFERRVAEYVGAPHAVAVDTCTAGLFLCLKYVGASDVLLPCKTYLGVACAAIHAGCRVELQRGVTWRGRYVVAQSEDYTVVDSACRFTRDCYGYGLTCYSFQYRKHLKIGRGGMICTEDREAADWLRKARFCGRSEPNGPPEFVGWHAFMEPERAARGLVLMDSLPNRNDDLVFEYPDLSEYEALKEHLA